MLKKSVVLNFFSSLKVILQDNRDMREWGHSKDYKKAEHWNVFCTFWMSWKRLSLVRNERLKTSLKRLVFTESKIKVKVKKTCISDVFSTLKRHLRKILCLLLKVKHKMSFWRLLYETNVSKTSPERLVSNKFTVDLFECESL